MAQPAHSTPSETTQTQVGQDGGAHSRFPPFDSSTFPSQLVWFAIAFGFLFWYMSKRGLPRLGAVIEGRKARIARDLDDATVMQQKADAAAAAHERTLAEARAKAQSLAQAARDAAAADAQAKRRAPPPWPMWPRSPARPRARSSSASADARPIPPRSPPRSVRSLRPAERPD